MIENYRVIGVLLDLLEDNKQTSKFYYCLQFLCEQTLAQYKKDIEYYGAERDQMKCNYDEKKGNQFDETKADNKWLNEDKFKDYCQNFVDKHIEQFRELNLVPIIRTTENAIGKGNKKLFWLETKPLDNQEDNVEESLDISKVHYTRADAKQIKLAFYVKPFFQKGEFINRSLKGMSFFMSWLLFSFIALGALISLAYTTTLMGNNFITLQLFFLIVLATSAFFLTKYLLLPFIRLPDIRVIKAPLLMLAWNEHDAEIEMHRDFKEQKTRFTRFTADCPICSGEIRLSNGEKDYKLALVGRCSESPMLHVYSFDRALLNGKLLSNNIVQ